MVKGKRLYRDACNENRSWNKEVSSSIAKDWNKWTKRLKDVKIPRSLIRDSATVEAVDIHQFADASNLACKMANKIRNNLDGHYGCLILDLEPRKVMESLCYK